MRYRGVLAVSIGFTVIAAVTWGLAGYWTDAHRCVTAMPMVRAVATVAAILAGVWWPLWAVLKLNHDKSVLIKTLAGAVPVQREARRVLAQTKPLRAHRAR